MSIAVHLSPLIDAGFQAFEVYVIPTLGTLAAAWLTAKFGSKLSADRQAALTSTLSAIADKAATFAAEHAKTEIADKGPLDISVGDARVAAFGNYMVAQAADTLKKSGVSTKVDAVTGKLPQPTVDVLKRMALARLPAKTEAQITDDLNAAQIRPAAPPAKND